LHLSQVGTRTVVFDIDGQAVVETVQAVSNGGQGITIEADVVNEVQINDLLHKVLRTYGAIHIFVNNAGISEGGLFENITIKE